MFLSFGYIWTNKHKRCRWIRLTYCASSLLFTNAILLLSFHFRAHLYWFLFASPCLDAVLAGVIKPVQFREKDDRFFFSLRAPASFTLIRGAHMRWWMFKNSSSRTCAAYKANYGRSNKTRKPLLYSRDKRHFLDSYDTSSKMCRLWYLSEGWDPLN